jgi:hypothetical protein
MTWTLHLTNPQRTIQPGEYAALIINHATKQLKHAACNSRAPAQMGVTLRARPAAIAIVDEAGGTLLDHDAV